MPITKNTRHDLKRKRQKVLEIGLILSLALLVSAFKFAPNSSHNQMRIVSTSCTFGHILNDNIIGCPVPEPPPKPKCPISIFMINKNNIDDVEFCNSELDIYAEVDCQPPPLSDSLEQVEDDAIIWFDSPELERWFSTPELERPKPIGGLVGILKRVVYPLSAIDNKIEGRVILRVYINEEGDAYQIDVIKSLSKECDEAAKRAVKETKFIPTKNKGKAIKSNVAIPIIFKLMENINED